MTKTLIDQKEEGRKKLAAFQENSVKYQKPVLDCLGVPLSHFSVKPGWFIPKDKTIPSIPPGERIIGLFPNECQKGHDLYMELYDMEKNPLEGRPLLKWIYNPQFDEEIPKLFNEKTNQISYIVPVSELIVVDPENAILNGVQDFEIETKSPLTTKNLNSTPVNTVTPAQVAPVQQPQKMTTSQSSGSIIDKTIGELTVRQLNALIKQKAISGNTELDMFIINS